MSKLDDIMEDFVFDNGVAENSSDKTGARIKTNQAIKTLILDLFKEVDYDPFEFVAKVKEL